MGAAAQTAVVVRGLRKALDSMLHKMVGANYLHVLKAAAAAAAAKHPKPVQSVAEAYSI